MLGWRYYRPTPSVYIVAALSGICAGLFVGHYSHPYSVLLVLLAIVTATIGKRLRVAYVLAVLMLGLLLGWQRGSAYARQVAQYDRYFGGEVTVMGSISDDPGYSDKKLVEFHISNPVINGVSLPGRVRVRTLGASSVGRGDSVRARGVLRKTLGTGRQGSLSYATVEIIHKNTSWVEGLRKRFFAAIFSALPEPQASLGLGYLVGVRTALPADFAAALAVVGLTHIVAVSGYNLTIIVQAVKRLFVNISAFQTVAFSFVLIAAFLVMTGWSPSIARAAIISGFSLLAWYFGRKFQPLVLLLLGAAITAFISPLYIWGDVGWYLSFLAFTGVLLVAPLVIYFLSERISKNLLIAVLVETLAAQALTVPYIAVIFGRVSVISPVANLLVVPFIPLAMLLVFITGIVGLVSPYLALWVAVPAKLLMSFTVWTVETLSSISWAQANITVSSLAAIAMYGIFALVIVVGWIVYKKRSRDTGSQVDWEIL